MNQVTMACTNIEKTKEFYQLLGLTLIVDAPHYLRLACPNDGATVSFILAEKVTSTTTVYFECNELNKRVSELACAGVIFSQMPTDQAYLFREAELCDPSGNKLKLYWAGKNRLHPPWRVTTNLF